MRIASARVGAGRAWLAVERQVCRRTRSPPAGCKRARPAPGEATRPPDLVSRERSFPDLGLECQPRNQASNTGRAPGARSCRPRRATRGGPRRPCSRASASATSHLARPRRRCSGQRADRADDADRLRPAIHLVAQDLAEGERRRCCRRAVSAIRLELRRPPDHELLLGPRRCGASGRRTIGCRCRPTRWRGRPGRVSSP